MVPNSDIPPQSSLVASDVPILSRASSDPNISLAETGSGGDMNSSAAIPRQPDPSSFARNVSDLSSYDSLSGMEPMTDQNVDWGALCRSLTGEDLDAYEVDMKAHLLEYYAASPSTSLIDSLDDSIRDMESRKAITMRIRKIGWVVTFAFFVGFVGSMGFLIGSTKLYLPISAICYAIGMVMCGVGTPMLGRQTDLFRSKPLLELKTLYRVLNAWATVTCVALFIGSIEFHTSNSNGTLPSVATVEQAEGWSRWILCTLPLFVGYLQHDFHSRAAVVWCMISGCALVLSHIINEFVIGSRDSSNVIVHSREWYLELSVQLLFLGLNTFFAEAASLSIQSHVVNLWHREKFMLEHGKYLAAQREAAFSTANQKSSFLANMSHEMLDKKTHSAALGSTSSTILIISLARVSCSIPSCQSHSPKFCDWFVFTRAGIGVDPRST